MSKKHRNVKTNSKVLGVYRVIKIEDIDPSRFVYVGKLYFLNDGVYLLKPAEVETGEETKEKNKSVFEKIIDSLAKEFETYKQKWEGMFGKNSPNITNPSNPDHPQEENPPLIYKIIKNVVNKESEPLAQRVEKLEKRIDALEKELYEIRQLIEELPSKIIKQSSVKEQVAKLDQSTGETTFTSTPPQLLPPPPPITTTAPPVTTPPRISLSECVQKILSYFDLANESIENIINSYESQKKPEEEILPYRIAYAIKTRQLYWYLNKKGEVEYVGDERLLRIVQEIFQSRVEGANEIYKRMHWPEDEREREIKRRRKELEEAAERAIYRQAGIFSI
ncbi:MAG: hypothetical protein QXL86_00795 [Candidatus Aenigmatarchaeota archaeon]